MPIQIILTLVNELPVALDLIQKIKAILSKDGTDVIIQIQELQSGTLKAAADTQAMAADWNAKHPVNPAG